MTDITMEMRGVRFSNMLVHSISRETNSLPCYFCLPENFYFHWCQFHKAGLALETKKKSLAWSLAHQRMFTHFTVVLGLIFSGQVLRKPMYWPSQIKKISMIVFACLRKTCQAENTTGYCKHGTIWITSY